MFGEVFFHRSCEGLDTLLVRSKADPNSAIDTYISACYHLLGNKLDVFSILRAATRLTDGKYVSKIILKKPRVAAIRQSGILLLRNLLADI